MRFLVAPVLAAVLLVGCSSSGSNETAALDEVTPQEELEAWAGDTCAAMSELQSTVVGLTDSIDIDLSAGLDQLPQIYADLETNITEIQMQVRGVEKVMQAAPESTPEAVQFATEVQALITSARTAGEEALLSANQAVEAANILEAGVSAANALASARTAYDDATAALALIDGVKTGGAGPLTEAFATAPECGSV